MFCFCIYNVQAHGIEVTPGLRAQVIIQASRVLVLPVSGRVLVIPVSTCMLEP
jgi:hypothetical protein